jgi:hypothetical protein
VSLGHFAPKPPRRSGGLHGATPTPSDRRLKLLRDTARQDRQFGKAIGFRYHDGWSEHFSYDRWLRCADEALTGAGSDVDWYTVRDRAFEVLPWDHLDSCLGQRTGSGLTGRTPWRRLRSKTAARHRGSTVVSVRISAPRSR